jgi:hypothetical protein
MIDRRSVKQAGRVTKALKVAFDDCLGGGDMPRTETPTEIREGLVNPPFRTFG